MKEFVQEKYPDFILTINLAVVNYFHMEAVEGTPTILRLLTNVPAIVEVLVKMFSYFLIFKVCIKYIVFSYTQSHRFCAQ